MAPAGGTDEVSSPGPSMTKCCPCKMTVRGRSVTWINCKNEDCGLSWHATCAGFSKSIKPNTVATLGEWMCPRCVMAKSFPGEKPASSDMSIEKITAKLNDIDTLKEDIKNIKTTIQSGFEFLENRVNENVELVLLVLYAITLSQAPKIASLCPLLKKVFPALKKIWKQKR